MEALAVTHKTWAVVVIGRAMRSGRILDTETVRNISGCIKDEVWKEERHQSGLQDFLP